MKMVTFYSDRFSQTPLPNAINDVLGHDLADWLLTRFRERGYSTGDVIGEDYGYGFWLNVKPIPFWINMGQYEPPGFEGHPLPRWLVSIDEDAGCLWVFRLRKRDPAAPLRIAQDLHAILLTEPSIQQIEWWAHDVRSGTPTPHV